MNKAACRDAAPEDGEAKRDLFFPGRGETNEEAILKYCLSCKVRPDCKDYADRIDAKVGVWGGERRTRATHGIESERRS